MILVILLLLLATTAQASTTVSADRITLHATDLSEFKADPHAPGSEGNQISGVVRRMLQDRHGHLWFATLNGV
jgi:ligand-binding sensor domain-containing protein